MELLYGPDERISNFNVVCANSEALPVPVVLLLLKYTSRRSDQSRGELAHPSLELQLERELEIYLFLI